MKLAFKFIATATLFMVSGGLFAQNTTSPPLQNVVSLSANGSVEQAQDWLTLTLRTSKDGADAAAVQAQLTEILDAALAQARKTLLTGQMEVRTGHFGIFPRYDKNSKINGWQGSAELLLEGRDFPRIAAAAGKLNSMTVANTRFSLSPAQRAKVEGQAQTMAIAQFKARAAEIARDFGFSAYTLREVSVSGNEGQEIHSRMLAPASAPMASDATIPMEAGKSTVQVNVSGSVQMR